ncbi:group II intron maturase-specific domain-containing protein [Leptospira noguchii]|uniref:group II intron maturase-specific domain-containing protein n=1 Tax=Leptospira noguchii TaxID=28182 RepID=UPI0002489F0B|nr:group II intron maturase-specific domain-containing protein [Leptospira noguchii]UOG43548.1 hypothetical protein MAL05_18085 [Leptospira noguchii]UOG62524.1 hypothetical protein MAL07_18400 [Leptospira noguchii]
MESPTKDSDNDRRDLQIIQSRLRGWLNYDGAFYKTEMRRVFEHFDRKVVLWDRRKYKKLRRLKRKSI